MNGKKNWCAPNNFIRTKRKCCFEKDNFFLEQYIFRRKNKELRSLSQQNKDSLLPLFCVTFFTDILKRASYAFLSVCYKFQQRTKKTSIFHGLLHTICIFIHRTMNKKNILVEKSRRREICAMQKGFKAVGAFFFLVFFCSLCCVCEDCSHLWHTINKDKKTFWHFSVSVGKRSSTKRWNGFRDILNVAFFSVLFVYYSVEQC